MGSSAIPTARDAEAQSSILRNSTRNLSRAVQTQTRAIFRPTLTVRGNLGPVQGLTIDNGWTYAATVLGNGAIALWDLRQGREVQRFPNPGMGPLREVHVGPNGQYVLLGSTSNQARLLTASSGSGVVPLPAVASSGVSSLGLSQDGSQAIVGRTDGSILSVTLATGAIRTLHQASGPITHVAQSSTGGFAAATASGALLLGTASGGVQTVQPSAAVTALAIAPDGAVSVGTANGTVETWNGATGLRTASNQVHTGAVTAIAAASGGLAVSADASGRLVRHAGGSATPSPTPLSGRVGGVAIRANPSRILAASADGTVHVLDGQTFRPLARMISNTDGWAVVSPEGRFDGAIDTYQDVVWSTPVADLPIDGFASTRFEPGLLSKSVQPGMTLSTRPAGSISQEVRLPPEVTLSVSPSSGAQAGQTLTVTVTAVNPSDGTIPRIRLFNNGKRVPPDAIVSESTGNDGGPSRTVTFGVPATAGTNTFSAVGLGWQDGESAPTTATVQAAGASPAGQLYLTSVGINTYRASGLKPLNFAASDAKSVDGLFKRNIRTPYAGVRDTMLLDRNATKSAILAHLKSLRTVTGKDVVVVYLAGHGMALDDDWYFLAADVSAASAGAIKANGISARELADSLRRIPAQQVLLLVDSCGSGAALQQFDGFEQSRFLDSLSRETGVHVLTAARAGQEAPEYSILNHGLFTYAFLQGFEGRGAMQADRAPRDGQVTVVEIKTYVEDMVPVVMKSLEKQLAQLSGARGGIANQTMVTPVGISRGADFVLSR